MWLLHEHRTHLPYLNVAVDLVITSVPGKLYAGQIQPAAYFYEERFKLKKAIHIFWVKKIRNLWQSPSVVLKPQLFIIYCHENSLLTPLWSFTENVSILLCFEAFQSQFYSDLGSELKTSVYECLEKNKKQNPSGCVYRNCDKRNKVTIMLTLFCPLTFIFRSLNHYIKVARIVQLVILGEGYIIPM